LALPALVKEPCRCQCDCWGGVTAYRLEQCLVVLQAVIGFAFGMFNTRYNQYVFFCYQGFEAMNRSIE
jgi:hypothetical protein